MDERAREAATINARVTFMIEPPVISLAILQAMTRFDELHPGGWIGCRWESPIHNEKVLSAMRGQFRRGADGCLRTRSAGSAIDCAMVILNFFALCCQTGNDLPWRSTRLFNIARLTGTWAGPRQTRLTFRIRKHAFGIGVFFGKGFKLFLEGSGYRLLSFNSQNPRSLVEAIVLWAAGNYLT